MSKILNMKISSITGLGTVIFLGLSVISLVAFSHFDGSPVLIADSQLSRVIGVSKVNAVTVAELQALEAVEPQPAPAPEKDIFVNLQTQTLTYVEGMRIIGEFKISSGVRSMPTPPGEYTVLKKKPLVDYIGPTYNYPRTKWNLMFKPGTKTNPLNYYIHGAYWHNNFGRPMSHGCINVSYANMEGLYNWADEGTKIHIH